LYRHIPALEASMVEPSRTDSNLHNFSYPKRSLMDESIFPGATAQPELPVSVAGTPERPSNPQLIRSALALGRGMGSAVAGVKSLQQQFDRLRSKIHLVNAMDASQHLARSGAEAAETAGKYQSIMSEVASLQIQELRRRSERSYFALRRDMRHRLEKVRRLSFEEPLRFIAGCAGAALVLGVALRVWRSNHE
jgi:hypothetical protein